jgi:membrane associated rhomboid family serine protease
MHLIQPWNQILSRIIFLKVLVWIQAFQSSLHSTQMEDLQYKIHIVTYYTTIKDAHHFRPITYSFVHQLLHDARRECYKLPKPQNLRLVLVIDNMECGYSVRQADVPIH